MRNTVTRSLLRPIFLAASSDPLPTQVKKCSLSSNQNYHLFQLLYDSCFRITFVWPKLSLPYFYTSINNQNEWVPQLQLQHSYFGDIILSMKDLCPHIKITQYNSKFFMHWLYFNNIWYTFDRGKCENNQPHL